MGLYSEGYWRVWLNFCFFWCGLLLGAFFGGLVGVDFWWGFLVGLLVRLCGVAFWWGFLVGLFGGACW